MFSDTTNMTSITIWDLNASLEYTLSIVTVSGSGNSLPATKIVMTTPLGEPDCLLACYTYRNVHNAISSECVTGILCSHS